MKNQVFVRNIHPRTVYEIKPDLVFEIPKARKDPKDEVFDYWANHEAWLKTLDDRP